MNPFCLKLDFLRNRLRVIYFWFLRYAFFLIVMLSGIYTPIYWLLKFSKWFKYALKGQNMALTSLTSLASIQTKPQFNS
mgnify:CR=1 FL=1